MSDIISIIICTRNRCESLKDTLNSIANQQLDGSFDFEAIVVDNNSIDKTKQIVQSYIPKLNNKLKYIFESEQGKTCALNMGIKESKGNIIVFTDDDVVVDQKWLMNIVRCFNNFSCDAVAGRILPLYFEKTSQWVKECADILCGPMVSHDYGDSIKDYKKEKMKPMVGANMALKKQCFDELGYFKTEFGPGKKIMADDTDIFFRLTESKKQIFYCGNAVAWHKVEKKRTNLYYIAKWFIALGRYMATKERISSSSKSVRFTGGVPLYLVKQILNHAACLTCNSLISRGFLINWRNLFTKTGMALEYRRIYKCKK